VRLSALAAALSAVLLVELDGVIHFHEGRHHMALRFNETMGASTSDGRLDVGVVALAAAAAAELAVGSLGLASRLVALKFALRARASGGLLALPVTLGLFAHGSANRLRSNARGTAVSRGANSLALGAVLGFAHVLGAANIALGLVAVNLALSASSLFALNLALRALAHRVALSRARRVVALPTALRVAVTLLNFGGQIRSHSHGDDQSQNNKSQLAHSDNRSDSNMLNAL